MLKPIRRILKARKQLNSTSAICIHKREITKIKSKWLLPLLTYQTKAKLQSPVDTEIVLIHNYQELPITEKSLRFAGIKDYTVISAPKSTKWSNSIKIPLLRDHLKKQRKPKKYTIFLDADDVIIRRNLELMIQEMNRQNCKLLFSNTGFDNDYVWMPELKIKADNTAKESGKDRLYINSGVYVAETSFLLDVLETALKYITPNDLSREEYRDARNNKTSMPNFPTGIGCDQVIFRYLFHEFYPKIKIDYSDILAYR